MTRLRQRMLEDMQLRGLSARTQGCYMQAVRQLADHYHRSPDRITEDDRQESLIRYAAFSIASRSSGCDDSTQHLPTAGSATVARV